MWGLVSKFEAPPCWVGSELAPRLYKDRWGQLAPLCLRSGCVAGLLCPCSCGVTFLSDRDWACSVALCWRGKDSALLSLRHSRAFQLLCCYSTELHPEQDLRPDCCFAWTSLLRLVSTDSTAEIICRWSNIINTCETEPTESHCILCLLFWLGSGTTCRE